GVVTRFCLAPGVCLAGRIPLRGAAFIWVLAVSTGNIFNEIRDRVRAANDRLIAEGTLPAGIDQSRIVVEPPRDPSHGDMATNAAMVLAKDGGKKPRELAEAMAKLLPADALVQQVEVAGPRFINLHP